MGAEYRILLRGVPLLNQNARHHWARKAKITRAIREATAWQAREQRIPHLDRVEITGVLHPAPTSRSRDGENWGPTAKAGTDGLRDAGVLGDDDSTHVVETRLRVGEPMPGGAYELIVRVVL